MNRSFSDELVISWNFNIFSKLVPVVAITSIYLLTGMLGNVTVILIYLTHMKQKKNRYFIPYLAVIDLVGILTGCVFSIVQDTMAVQFPGNGLCQFFWFCGMGTSIASALLLITIAIQRYMLVCKPHRRQMTLFLKRVSLFGVCALSVVLSVPMVLFFDQVDIQKIADNGTEITGIKCDVKLKFKNSLTLFIHNTFLLSISVIFIITLIVFYVLIARTIYTTRKKVIKLKPRNEPQNIQQDKNSSHTENQDEDSQTNVQYRNKMAGNLESKSRVKSRLTSIFKKHRFSWMFMTITAVWIITFVPRLALMVEEALDKTFWINQTVLEMNGYRFLYRLYLVNHIANPLIYGYHDIRFRNCLKKALFCKT